MPVGRGVEVCFNKYLLGPVFSTPIFHLLISARNSPPTRLVFPALRLFWRFVPHILRENALASYDVTILRGVSHTNDSYNTHGRTDVFGVAFDG